MSLWEGVCVCTEINTATREHRCPPESTQLPQTSVMGVNTALFLLGAPGVLRVEEAGVGQGLWSSRLIAAPASPLSLAFIAFSTGVLAPTLPAGFISVCKGL